MKISSLKAISYLHLTSLACLILTALASPASTAGQGDGSPAVASEAGLSSSESAQADHTTKPETADATETADPKAAETDNAGAEAQPELRKEKVRASVPDSDPLPLSHKHEGFVSLKAGQKLKITGFAEQQEATVVEAGVHAQEPASYHQARMRLTGSMCFACLHELQEKLKQIFGVERVSVEKSNKVSIQTYSPDLANYADADIVYDAGKVDFIDLRAYMKVNGYFPYKVSDKSIDALPAERKKKSES